MSNRDPHNRKGLLGFFVAFGAIGIFFIVVLIINPGPIDRQVFEVPIQFSTAEANERDLQWRMDSKESAEYGQKLYQVNCQFCHSKDSQDIIVQRFISGETVYGAKQSEIYKGLAFGLKPGFHQLNHLPEHERWALIHFLRSKMTNPPSNSESDLKKLKKYEVL